ncbi:RNA-dependent RNA polymerase [Striga asiatica]|uniref:RNA-dependent RNA polymerase n=1 Tax=Striga asiatica TaxID=4170 RepID=A0A5A7Q2I0_STRAF|nr:RNA-dependent RNA polymerase [Striga asiatica]
MIGFGIVICPSLPGSSALRASPSDPRCMNGRSTCHTRYVSMPMAKKFQSKVPNLIGFCLQTSTLFELSISPFLYALGKSARVVEGGGKRRVFAIGNYVSQVILRPIHNWLMDRLRSIPMDGTFDQERPLLRLVPADVCFSYDLKSATDRWPIALMSELLKEVFGPTVWTIGIRSLGLSSFTTRWFPGGQKSLSFRIGQPLGICSSGGWAVIFVVAGVEFGRLAGVVSFRADEVGSVTEGLRCVEVLQSHGLGRYF